MRKASRLATLMAVLALVVAAPAAATDVTANQFSALASAASTDNAAALDELQGVTAIDGRPVSLASALSGANQAQMLARIKVLTAPRAGEPTLISDSGAKAATILHALGYKTAQRTAAGSSQSSGGLPGPAALWLAIGVLVVVLSTLAASRALARLEPAIREAPPANGDPDDQATRASLERDAAAAEARGAFSEAVRLRFRAGLLALARKSVIDGRASLRDAEISRQVESPEFDRLAHTFERVAYGGEPASAEDAGEAREGWPRVVSGASR
jgi:hypothetical protein